MVPPTADEDIQSRQASTIPPESPYCLVEADTYAQRQSQETLPPQSPARLSLKNLLLPNGSISLCSDSANGDPIQLTSSEDSETPLSDAQQFSERLT